MGNILNEQLLNKELTRKEFLKYMAGFGLAIVGISGLVDRLKNLPASTNAPKITNTEAVKGFGNSKFGV